MTLGEAIKIKRETLGMTQQDLAGKLFVSRQTVCRWENGSRCPDLIMAKKLAIVLGISLDDLIPGDAVQDYTLPKEPPIDISCVKVMLTGVFLLLVGLFLYEADAGYWMDFAFWCFIGGVITFVVGLFIPMHKKDAIIDDALPQRKCPQCGKNHDFDYPACPHCNYEYNIHPGK